MPRSWGWSAISFNLGRAQNASGAPAWTAVGVLARPGELDLSRRRIRIDRRRGLPGFPLFGPAVAQQLAEGFEQVPAVQPQRQLRLPQIRAGDGARLRAGLPALRIRTGRAQHLPRVRTADLPSGTLFGSSVGTDERYDFER